MLLRQLSWFTRVELDKENQAPDELKLDSPKWRGMKVEEESEYSKQNHRVLSVHNNQVEFQEGIEF